MTLNLCCGQLEMTSIWFKLVQLAHFIFKNTEASGGQNVKHISEPNKNKSKPLK